MKIKTIKLENIRSHENTKIEFEDGITILNGRTGSGKSSILMAIEYALFGAKSLDNNTQMLKRGADNGRVVLEFVIEGRTYRIVRGLKRSGNNIHADPDNMEIFLDNILMPIFNRTDDINQKILEILKFPTDIKNPVELFEVISYTKQDEIRKLIELSTESRQEQIDNVLQLSKYKNTYNNLRGIINVYENRMSKIEGLLESLNYLENEADVIKNKILSDESALSGSSIRIESIKNELAGVVNSKKMMKDTYESLIEEDKKHAELRGNLEQIKSELERINKENSAFMERLAQVKNGLSEMKDVEGIDDLQVQRARIEGRVMGLKAEIENLEKEMEKIDKLRDGMDCPTCEQGVTREHIAKIKNKYENKIHDKYTVLSDLEVSLRSYKERMDAASKLDAFKSEINRIELALKEREDQARSLIGNKQKIESELGAMHTTLQGLDAKRKELEGLEQKELSLSREVSSIESIIISLQKNIAEDKLMLAEKEKKLIELQEQKKKMEKTGAVISVLNRLRDDIRDIREIVRSRFLMNLRAEFQKTFENLRLHENDYSVDVKPDYEPVCYTSEGGEEVPIINLSGGEKTSVAMAYRLSLSDIAAQLGGVQRTEVLLLDEPTLGFDRDDIKEIPTILRNIETIPQIILVTHVQELKEAADHLYTIEKVKGTSTVIK